MLWQTIVPAVISLCKCTRRSKEVRLNSDSANATCECAMICILYTVGLIHCFVLEQDELWNTQICMHTLERQILANY